MDHHNTTLFLLQKAFIESLLDLFEQETEDMIDAIEESRMELRGTMLDFEDETEQLRAESRMLGTPMPLHLSLQLQSSGMRLLWCDYNNYLLFLNCNPFKNEICPKLNSNNILSNWHFLLLCIIIDYFYVCTVAFVLLEQQRLDYEKNAVDRYLEKKGRKGQGSRASSRVSIVNERDDARSRAAVVDYIRKKKDRSGSSLSVHSNPNVRSPSSNDRPVSVISSRSLPTPVMSQKTIEEVLDNNLLQNFSQWAMAFNYKLSQVFVSITYLY